MNPFEVNRTQGNTRSRWICNGIWQSFGKWKQKRKKIYIYKCCGSRSGIGQSQTRTAHGKVLLDCQDGYSCLYLYLLSILFLTSCPPHGCIICWFPPVCLFINWCTILGISAGTLIVLYTPPIVIILVLIIFILVFVIVIIITVIITATTQNKSRPKLV